MSHRETRSPALPASGNRANEVQFAENIVLATPDETPDFAAAYVAKRYRLPMQVAAVFARLAGGMLS
jgi:hypothetical protein